MKFFEQINEENDRDYYRIFIIATLLLLSILQIYGISTRRERIELSPVSNTSSSLLNFCALVSDQLINKKLSPELFHKTIFDGLSNNNYAVLNFNNKEELLLSSETKEGCTTILRDDLGIRIFKMGISKNEDNPAFYAVHAFSEL